jgi:Domain of unknown function (DUF929)
VAVIAIVIGVALVVTIASGTDHDPTHGTGATTAPAPLVGAITSIPARVYSAVGLGTAAPLPKKIAGPMLATGGKPRIVYVGAEYCPFCATERWAMVAALSRFGTFRGLKTTTSSALDEPASIETLSFHQSRYSSPYIEFEGVEQLTNIFSGGNYTKLDTITADQQSLFDRFDYPPYAESEGAIPFIDFANRYLITGATYEPRTLQGKSWTSIADAMRDPASAVSKGAIGSANMMTAAICTLTNDRPAPVCSDPAIARIQHQLG